MEPNQFDRAAALYREEPVVLYYLDHDPVAAAQAACDTHVVSGITSAVAMLSCAWHELNPWFLPFDMAPPYGEMFSNYTAPAIQRDRVNISGPDPFYQSHTGDHRLWLLGGQVINDAEHTNHPNAVWARSSEGNYRWVHAWGWACAQEYKHRFGGWPPSTPKLWTLEAVPPYIEPGSGATEPTPVVPGDSIVTDAQGYFDTPASYGVYYRLHKQPLLQWTNRTPPVWAQP